MNLVSLSRTFFVFTSLVTLSANAETPSFSVHVTYFIGPNSTVESRNLKFEKSICVLELKNIKRKTTKKKLSASECETFYFSFKDPLSGKLALPEMIVDKIRFGEVVVNHENQTHKTLVKIYDFKTCDSKHNCDEMPSTPTHKMVEQLALLK